MVPKTNRMSEITSYRQTYARRRDMLPSIHKYNDQKTANYVPKASLHQNLPPISGLRNSGLP